MMKIHSKISTFFIAGIIGLAAPTFSRAAIPVGALAPAVHLNAALAGKSFDFDLKNELKKGPVVLYFFPAAFTSGCTLEAHLFAEASDNFAKMGARVVGITAGNIDRVADFSKLECRNKFVVAADPRAKVASQYHTLMKDAPQAISERTSFVIAPDDKILLSYTDQNPAAHIEKTMATVRAWKEQTASFNHASQHG